MPLGYKVKIKRMLELSGSRISVKGFVNYSFSLSLVVGFLVALLVRELFFPVWVVVFLAMYGLFHGFLALAVEKRTSSVEEVLPDALQLMAANNRAGYIPSKALLLSARPEFGALSEAIKKAGKDILTGEPLEGSLKKISKTIRSDILEKTIKLVIEGTRSGGHFAALLEENADDIRRVQTIRKEIKANVTIYIIFITFAGVLAAPVLYALAGFLIKTLGGISSSATLPDTSAISFIQIGGLGISPDFVFMFSMLAILITSVFGGLIIGMISSGKAKAGIRYVPIFVVLSIGVYFFATYMIDSLFSSFAFA